MIEHPFWFVFVMYKLHQKTRKKQQNKMLLFRFLSYQTKKNIHITYTQQ